MEITPGLNNENIKVVENIKILDPRYATDEGISLHSTFKDIKNQYTINRIENSISSIVLFIDEAHLYIALTNPFYRNNIVGTCPEVLQLKTSQIKQ